MPGARGPAGAEGPQGPRGTSGADGLAGRGITDIDLLNGELLITYSDGQVVNLGSVVGPAGAQGAPGEAGAAGDRGIQGPIGPAGENGADGRGVANMQINDGDVVVSYSDGQEQNLGNIAGPQGPQGVPGADGPAGPDGAQGVGITDVAIDGDGDLLVSLSNGESLNAGSTRDQAASQTPLTDLFVEAPRSQNTPVDVPRASNQGTDSILDIDYNGVITDISVVVDITHPDIAQLEVLLIAPNGASYQTQSMNLWQTSRPYTPSSQRPHSHLMRSSASPLRAIYP